MHGSALPCSVLEAIRAEYAGPRARNSLPPALRLPSTSHSISKNIWNHLCLDNLFVCDNVHTDYFSVLVAVCTACAYCAIQNVMFTLLYYICVRRAFRFSAPSVWNSLPQTVLISDSLSVFESRLKTFLFNQAFPEHWSGNKHLWS